MHEPADGHDRRGLPPNARRSREMDSSRIAPVPQWFTCSTAHDWRVAEPAREVGRADLQYCSPKGGIFEVILRFAIVFLLLGTSAGSAQDRKATPLEQQGRALAERMCSACHAIGRRGKSPH